MPTNLSPTGAKLAALGIPTSGKGGGGGGGGGEVSGALVYLYRRIGGIVKTIRRFERFVNSLPMDWIIGILLGILAAAWALYQVMKVAGGG